MVKRMLIIGGSGLVGSTLAEYACSNYEIHLTYNRNVIDSAKFSGTKIDLLENTSEIINLIKSFKPDFVIHTAAHPSVDLCEIDHKIANRLHVDTTKKITEICKKIDAKLIFFSTDAVFPGKLNKKYRETDQERPINYYAKTKLMAEKIVMQGCKKNIVLRTSVVYGWHKNSRFTNWILSSLMEKKSVDPHIDQYNTPTLVDNLAEAILRIFEKKISGIYHATGKTCVNRYEFALILAKKFKLNKNLIKSATASTKRQIAPRPTCTCLDSSLLENLIGYNFYSIEEGVAFIFNKFKNK